MTQRKVRGGGIRFLTGVMTALLLGREALAVQDMALRRIEEALGRRIASDIEEALISYYNRQNFMVDVRVSLGSARDEESGKQGQSPSKSQENPNTIELPGLPTPFEAAGTKLWGREGASGAWLDENLIIKWLEITVLLAENTYSQQDVTFIVSAAKLRSGFDEKRGDIFNIRQIPFPSLSASKSLAASKNLPGAKGALQFIFDQPWYVWALFGLFGLVLFFQFLIFRRTAKRMALPDVMAAGNVGPAHGKPAFAGQAASSAVTASAYMKPIEGSPSNGNGRASIAIWLVGDPETSGKILKKWIGEDQEKGFADILGLLHATEPAALPLLSPYLGQELASRLAVEIQDGNEFDKEGAKALQDRFRGEFHQVLLQKSSKAGGEIQDHFSFIRQLEIHQILHLVNGEPPGVIAIVLAQLAPELAVKVFKELNAESQGKVPLELGHLRKIPLSVYKDIAERLSKKAAEVARVKYVSTDGIEALVGILERLDPDSEKGTFSLIREQDLNLTEELRKVYLSFSEIGLLPERSLSDVLRTLPRETIVKALLGAQDEIREKVLSSMPERLRVMIKDQMDTMDSVPREEIEKAQQTIIHEIRALAKAGKIDLQKLLGDNTSYK
ncbi:MAG: hypothetical protein HY547_02725 [Elusimicrobia bacterium]|nr:hypothetical protein [Elusimicrobiota bacterium]